MKKRGVIAFLVGLFLLGQSASGFALCDSTVKIGTDGCGGSNDCDYSSWDVAASNCVGTYTKNLTFELYNYVDSTVLKITGAYNIGSGYTFTIHPEGGTITVNGKWDASRFRSDVGSGSTVGYALFIQPAGTGQMVLDGLQIFRQFTNASGSFSGLVTLASKTTFRNSFIWMQTSADATFGQKGVAITVGANGDGYDKNIENVVILGERLKSGGSGAYLERIIDIKNYSRTTNVTNLTAYGGEGDYKVFVSGVYSWSLNTSYVNNSYIRTRSGSCTPFVTGGDYNVCSGSTVVGANSHVNYSTDGDDDFADPKDLDYPDFRLESGSVLRNYGHHDATHTEQDIEGDTRPTSGTLAVGVDEY